MGSTGSGKPETCLRHARDPLVNHIAAELLEKMGRFSDAETLYKRSSLLDPERSDSQVALLRLRCWREEYKEVKEETEVLLSAHGESPELHRILGIIHLREGCPEHALTHFDRALLLRPGDPETLFWRADYLRGQEWRKPLRILNGLRSSSTLKPLRIVYRLHSGKLHFKGLAPSSFPIIRRARNSLGRGMRKLDAKARVLILPSSFVREQLPPFS